MQKTRLFKGQSLFSFLDNYTVVDIETTGFYPETNEILEISAVRVRENAPVATFSSLAKPDSSIPYHISQLTGITDRLVSDAPPISEVLYDFVRFLDDDVIVGYNVNFDVNFLYDNLLRAHGMLLTNSFVDVLRIARRLLRNLPDHKQTTVASYYGISVEGSHRALRDCEICRMCYFKLKEQWLSEGLPV